MVIDYAEMALAAANWMLDQKHESVGAYHDGTRQSWVKTRSSTHPFHYRDGVRVVVSKFDLTPDEEWP